MNKELAVYNFREMIKQSWTYEKMTSEEKDTWERVLNSIQTLDSVKGSYNNRWKVLQAIYNSYLLGLGYNGFAWRESEE